MSNQIKVDVNLEEIQDGSEMILCLADQQILNGDELNDAQDILENEMIKVQDKIKLNEKKKEQIKKSHGTQKYDIEDKKDILDKYDELKITKEGFYLNVDGSIAEEPKKDDLSLIKNKLNRNQQISLNITDQIASDYKAAIPTTLMKKKFQKPQQANPFSEDRIKHVDKAVLEEDDYELLQRSILNQQKKKLNQPIKEENIKELIEQNKTVEQEQTKNKQTEYSVPQLKNQNGEVQEIKIIEQSTDFLSNVKTDKEMEEINLRITSGFSIKDTRNGTMSVVNVRLPTERILQQNRQQQKTQMEIENLIDNQDQKNESIKNEDEENQGEKINEEDNITPLEILEEEQHGQGLTATLDLLRKRGELNPSKYDYVGRNKDQKRFDDQNIKDGEINLVYRDHTGKLMTPKEAFRYQCWIFHGEGPSKNKIEKRKRRDLVRQKQKMKSQSEAPLLQALKDEQKKKGVAHMVIGKKKY